MKLLKIVFVSTLICAAALAGEPKRVSHTAALESATNKVTPDYSPIAKQLKIQGAVHLDAVIAEDGSVERVDIVSGNPVLTKPASEALKKWRFKPFLDEEKPVKVIATFDFDFKL